METNLMIQWAESIKHKADVILRDAENQLRDAERRRDYLDNKLRSLQELIKEPASEERTQRFKSLRQDIIRHVFS